MIILQKWRGETFWKRADLVGKVATEKPPDPLLHPYTMQGLENFVRGINLTI